jgi:hypothetical protein
MIVAGKMARTKSAAMFQAVVLYVSNGRHSSPCTEQGLAAAARV